MLFARRGPSYVLPIFLLALLSSAAQQSDPSELVTTGHLNVSGRQVPYRIRHLPISSFPDLPPDIAAALDQRHCLIPQTYEAHRPENVVHGSFDRRGSSDLAVLCSAGGKVSLLVFLAGAPAQPTTLVTAQETDRLQSYPDSHELGFNWGIDAVSPQTIHDAQNGMHPRPPRLDHDALADSVIEHKTIYHYFHNNSWSLVDLPD